MGGDGNILDSAVKANNADAIADIILRDVRRLSYASSQDINANSADVSQFKDDLHHVSMALNPMQHDSAGRLIVDQGRLNLLSSVADSLHFKTQGHDQPTVNADGSVIAVRSRPGSHFDAQVQRDLPNTIIISSSPSRDTEVVLQEKNTTAPSIPPYARNPGR
jgi:hypothetical protein